VTARVLLLILLIWCHFSAAQRVIEEVLAVVDTTPILLSDVELAELVQLAPPEPGEVRTDYRSRVLDARIHLELQYRDLSDGGTLYRLDLDSDRSLGVMVDRAGGEERLRSRLPDIGLTWADVEQLSVRVAAAIAYTEQRLRPRINVTLEELQAAYQTEVVDRLEEIGQPAPPLPAVRDQLHRLVVERKLNAEIERWLDGTRERHEVTRFVR
jgi:hypothetical protein